MEDFFEHYGISNEARVSIILNTFMYIDDCIDIDDFYRKKFRYPTLKEVVEQISIEPEHVQGSSDWDEAEWGSKPKEDSNNGALYSLQKYLARDEYQDIANLEVVNFSDQMGEEYKGAYAATFRDPNSSNIFVVYRGTGLGRWFDNGIGLSQEASPIQGVAQRFFDDTISQLGLTENANLIVTGHSKGGNLAQYTTLTAENRALIDKCISFDGQGFSPEFFASLHNLVFCIRL